MSTVSSAHLGIDFGTSHTVAVLRRADGRIEALVFDGTPLMPSAVFAEPDGAIHVGADAAHSARTAPASFEPHPKRRVDNGTVLLGDREFAVEDLFAAVFGAVAKHCAEVVGAVPATVTLTHPATWGPRRKRILRAAAERAGLSQARFVPEPVAAATYYADELSHDVPVGEAVVVHDFGGGTFDASVVSRTEQGFEVLAVDGLDDLGGVDIDEALTQHLRAQYPDPEAWRHLLTPETPADHRHARLFREDVRLTKERLSRQAVAELHIPVLDKDVHVTREELEGIAAPLLARAVAVTSAVIEEAGVEPKALAGIFLVGGGSRIPLVATLLHRELGRAPRLADQVEQVVARGSILGERGEPRTRSTRFTTVPPPPPPPSPTTAPPSPPPPSIAPARELRLGPRVAHPVWVLAALLLVEALAMFLPVGGGRLLTGSPSLIAAFVVPVASLIVMWVRRPLSRLVVLTGQFVYMGVHLALAVFDQSGWTAELVRPPFVVVGFIGVELAASRSAIEWFKASLSARRPAKTVERRAITAITVVSVLSLAQLLAPLWAVADPDPAAPDSAASEQPMPVPDLREVGFFTTKAPYIALATYLRGKSPMGVGLRADARVDVFEPFGGGVVRTLELPFANGTDIDLIDIGDRLRIVVGSPGRAYAFDAANGSTYCDITEPAPYFTEIAVGKDPLVGDLMAGIGSADFGLWSLPDCKRVARFGPIPPGGASRPVLESFGSSAALYFATDKGIWGYWNLDADVKRTDSIALPGRPLVSPTTSDTVYAVGGRVAYWNGEERSHVDIGAAIVENGLASERTPNGSVLAAMIDATGTLHVCDMSAGKGTVLGAYKIGPLEGTPLVAFAASAVQSSVLVAVGTTVTVFQIP